MSLPRYHNKEQGKQQMKKEINSKWVKLRVIYVKYQHEAPGE
jgi:hypothetical protein